MLVEDVDDTYSAARSESDMDTVAEQKTEQNPHGTLPGLLPDF